MRNRSQNHAPSPLIALFSLPLSFATAPRPLLSAIRMALTLGETPPRGRGALSPSPLHAENAPDGP